MIPRPRLVESDQAESSSPDNSISTMSAAAQDKAPEPIALDSKLKLLQEYVSAGSNFAAASMARALPRYIDDATADFGDDLYDRMMRDPVCFSSISTLKRQALADGGTFQPPMDAPADAADEVTKARYAKAQHLAEFVQFAVDCAEEDFFTVLEEMLDALSHGNRVAELTAEYAIWDGQKKLVLRHIKPKPRKATAFVVDAFNNVVGIVGMKPGGGGILALSSFDPAAMVDMVQPREKFAVLTHKPKDADPRGTSLLRQAYNPWYVKQQVWPEFLKYLVQFGSPSLWATTSENEPSTIKLDDGGTPVLDTDGNAVELTAEQALLAKLLDFRNGAAAAFKFGTELHTIGGDGSTSAFVTGIPLLDRQITLAILGATRATMESEHGSRADSQTAQDMVGLAVAYVKNLVSRMVEKDIAYRLLEWNFGPDVAREYCPKFVMSASPQEDFAANVDAISRLFASGYIADDQLAGIDSKLGLPARNMDEWVAKRAAEEEAKLAAAQARARLFTPAPVTTEEKPTEAPAGAA